MATNTITPNMNLIVPTVGQELGPAYAFDVNNSLVLIDQHDHSVGEGVQITPSGLNINANLNIQDNLLLNVGGMTLQPQLASPANNTIFEQGVDLYYTDGLGNVIQITKSGGVAGANGSIAGLVPPASATYVPGTSTFVWQSNAGIAANMDAGSYILRNLSPNSTFGVTLQAPAGLSSNYNVILPTLPGANSFLQISPSGAMSATIPIAAGITSSNIAAATILGSNIAATTVAGSNMVNNTITNTQVQVGFALIPTAKYKGYYPLSNSNYWQNANISAYANYTPVGTIPAPTTLYTLGSSFSPALPSGSLPGLTFTAPTTGVMSVTFHVYHIPGTSSQTVNFQLIETTTSTTLDYPTLAMPSATFSGYWTTMSGLLNVTASTTYTVILKGCVPPGGGTFFIGETAPVVTTSSCLTIDLIYV